MTLLDAFFAKKRVCFQAIVAAFLWPILQEIISGIFNAEVVLNVKGT